MNKEAKAYRDENNLLIYYKDEKARQDIAGIKIDYALKSDIPEWSMNTSKPTYTASEVGAISTDEAATFAKKDDIPQVGMDGDLLDSILKEVFD